MKRALILVAAVSSFLVLATGATVADESDGRACSHLPGHAELTTVLKSVAGFGNAGVGNDVWAAIVNQDGIVCAVTFSGPDRHAQWEIARLVSAQKAHTSNLLSLSAGDGGFLLAGIGTSTANLWAGAQPGGSLYGIQWTHPVATNAAYRGNPADYGSPNDPMVGRRIGGIVVIGGGLPLYDTKGVRIGGLGLGGDTACSDHIQAWKVRDALGLDNVPFGLSPTNDDNIIFDIVDDVGGNPESPSGFGHPYCFFPALEQAAADALPMDFPIGPNPDR